MTCKWIKEMVDKEKEIEFQTIYFQFFRDTFTSQSNVATNIQLDGFETFQTMMCRINEHQGLFCALDSGANSTVNTLGYVTAMSSAPQDDDKTDKPTFEYQVAAHPDTLTGIAFLWEIVDKNPRDPVIERAA